MKNWIFFENKYGLDSKKLSMSEICNLAFLNSKVLKLREQLNNKIDEALKIKLLKKNRIIK